MISKKNIDDGKEFDWGKTSEDYRKFRDIYPESFYDKLRQLGIGLKGQKILDLGTGTGVLPRGLYKYGAEFIGTDISLDQIENAKLISKELGMNIEYYARAAENTGMPSSYFDVITACQCFLYFDKELVLPEIKRMLKKKGKFATMWMAWLPNEDRVSNMSEDIILKYNPNWNGAGYTRMKIDKNEWSKFGFILDNIVSYDELIPFTIDSWAGRIIACRGIGASLSKELVNEFDMEHRELLKKNFTNDLKILHHILLTTFTVES